MRILRGLLGLALVAAAGSAWALPDHFIQEGLDPHKVAHRRFYPGLRIEIQMSLAGNFFHLSPNETHWFPDFRSQK